MWDFHIAEGARFLPACNPSREGMSHFTLGVLPGRNCAKAPNPAQQRLLLDLWSGGSIGSGEQRRIQANCSIALLAQSERMLKTKVRPFFALGQQMELLQSLQEQIGQLGDEAAQIKQPPNHSADIKKLK